MALIRTILVSFIVSLAVVAGGLYYYHKHYEVKIVAVNFNSWLKNQEKQFILGKITKKQLMEKLNYGLSIVYHQPKGSMVLSGECVLKGRVIKIK